MKKKVQTGCLIGMLLLSATTFAQTTIQEPQKVSNDKRTAKTYLDLMVNVASTNINYGSSNSSLADYRKSTKGIQAGISFQAGITAAFSLVAEFYYIRKGGELKQNNPLTNDQSTIRLNTLELPVLARLHIGKCYVNAGPSVAYNLSGVWKINDQSNKLSFGNSAEGLKRFDAGIQFGGGVELPFKQKRIALDIRYTHGLTNISYNKEMYNRAVMISVHFSKPWKTNPFAKRK
ncbi:MAG: porin family protein [Ferruginibacter sp.]